MKKILITIMMCVLLFCQTGWGCQDEPQDCGGGLVDIVLDIVTAPCSLLAACLGLDTEPCVYLDDSQAICAPVPRSQCCVNPAPLKSASPYPVPVTRAVSHSRKSEPAKFVEPLVPAQKPLPETSTPPVIESLPEPRTFPETKIETAAPPAPEVKSVPLPPAASNALPEKPWDTTAPQTEGVLEQGQIRPKIPEVIPLAPDIPVSQPTEKIQEVKKPVASENAVTEVKREPPVPKSEVVGTRSTPEAKETVKEKPKQKSKSRKRPCGQVYPPACGPRFFYR
jgi:hypothetical protein